MVMHMNKTLELFVIITVVAVVIISAIFSVRYVMQDMSVAVTTVEDEYITRPLN
jgi:hypothetical protein